MSAPAAMARWIAARWRRSLVLSLTVLGIGAVALFALVLSRVVGDQIRDDALTDARGTAELVARSSFAPRLPAPGRPLSRRARRELDQQVAAARASRPGTRVLLFDGQGRSLYASGLGGGTPERSVRSEPGTRVVGTGASRRVQSVLPVRTSRAAPPAAYLQLETPYGPVASAIRSRTRRLNLLLALTAAAVYLLALPSLLRAGRAVRAQYDPRRLELIRDVKRGIRRGEFSLEYQPIVSADDGRVRSVEALVRWTSPQRGRVSPGVFIPAVEQTDAIWDLSAHIFALAFEQCAEWREGGLDIPIALNVSGAVLLDRRLIPELGRLGRKHGLPPDTLELEITEGALVEDSQHARDVLREIAGIGLRIIAIDDFGTGYSSLARLHELPLDTLKVDQSFVMRMAREGDDAIVRSVIDLAHALGLDVIAEGVEDQDTVERLRALGAEYLQGYHVSRPLAPDRAEGWLTTEPGVPLVRPIQDALPL